MPMPETLGRPPIFSLENFDALAPRYWDHSLVRKYFEPYPEDKKTGAPPSLSDAVATFSYREFVGEEIRQIIFLWDYWTPSALKRDDKKQSLNEAVTYCGHCWNRYPSEQKDRDSTLSVVYWSPWFRRLLEGGETLVLNPLLGIRKKVTEDNRCYNLQVNDDEIETISRKEYEKDFEVLLEWAKDRIMLPVIRGTEAKRIFLCKAELHWLLEKEDFGLLHGSVILLPHPSYDPFRWATVGWDFRGGRLVEDPFKP